MLLRCFVVADQSELGLACLSWCRFLLALDETVRFLAPAGADIMPAGRGEPPNPWAELREHFATPLEDEYVNIVMTPLCTWDKFWASKARRNIAIVPVDFSLDDLLAANLTRSYDLVVYGAGGGNVGGPALSAKQWGGQVAISPLASNLEDFRAVALP